MRKIVEKNIVVTRSDNGINVPRNKVVNKRNGHK